MVIKLEELLLKSQTLKHGLARAKRVKLIRSELTKAKKNAAAANTDTDPTSQSDGDNESTDTKISSANSGENNIAIVKQMLLLMWFL